MHITVATRAAERGAPMASTLTARDETGSRRRRRSRLIAPVAVIAAFVWLASGCVMNGAWAATSPVQEPSGSGTFAAVDCVGPTWCLAGGQGNGAPAVQTWNGSTWTVRTPPAAGPLGTGSVVELDCLIADRCIAVVHRPTAQSAYRWNVESWDGATWSAVPGVPVLTSPALASTSCFVGACVISDYASETMITWDGATFDTVAAPSVGSVGDISCVSADDCLSGGDYYVASRWNGVAWTLTTAYAGASIIAIDCPRSTDECVAVGSTDLDEPVLLTWDGEDWAGHALPDGVPQTRPRDVSCASGNECIVLGTPTAYAGSAATQLAWNGSDWFAATELPSTPSASSTALSCAPLWCMAVGTDYAAPYQRLASTYTWTNS